MRVLQGGLCILNCVLRRIYRALLLIKGGFSLINAGFRLLNRLLRTALRLLQVSKRNIIRFLGLLDAVANSLLIQRKQNLPLGDGLPDFQIDACNCAIDLRSHLNGFVGGQRTDNARFSFNIALGYLPYFDRHGLYFLLRRSRCRRLTS
ncbi:hypothetical protein DJ90_6214 [Paenibacillus macerans]|uniref:Uncharacterized protein n=1 Tax=Paenibacillus macerans TaxID=44252 RepID=A0A090XS63_PAEMA|nr:hypothetical protein DJ90_6214 [Paenibacillus macerans]